jgi:hypothetical protein
MGRESEALVLGRPWGFALPEIRIADCHARIVPGEGHLLVIDHIVEVIHTLGESY